MITELTTDNLIPLSANYPYSDGVTIKSTISKWKDGYTMYSHPLFNNNIDCSLNNNGILYLTSAANLFNIIEETTQDLITLGDYSMLQLNSKYVTNVNNVLQLTTLSSDEAYFRIIVNDDDTYSFLQSNGLYVTVANQNPFYLTLEGKLPTDEIHHQKFNITFTGNQLYITTDIINESDVGGAKIERYWGYIKYGPNADKMIANGTIANNDYLFTVTSFNTNVQANGLTRDHTWVSYYNEFENTENNKTVEINNIQTISGVKVNHLVDLPYNTTINISNGQMNVNFANMKNIQTANYEYRKK